MSAARRFGAALVAVLALGGLTACGEKPQERSARKADATSHSGSTVAGYTAPGWKPGDKTSWESQIRDRNKGQNEYQR